MANVQRSKLNDQVQQQLNALQDGQQHLLNLGQPVVVSQAASVPRINAEDQPNLNQVQVENQQARVSLPSGTFQQLPGVTGQQILIQRGNQSTNFDDPNMPFNNLTKPSKSQ